MRAAALVGAATLVHVAAASAALAAAPKAPSAAAKRTLAAAIRLYHKLDLQAASRRFDEALVAAPGWKTAAGFRASCRWTMGDAAGAQEDARLAAKLQPNDLLSYASRGRGRLVLRDYDGAMADFRAASAKDRMSVEGPLGEGSVLSAQGRGAEALKKLDEAVNRDPSSAAALLMRGSVKDRQRDFAGAAADYGSIVELSPGFSWAHFYRGKALRELKDYRGSEAELTAFLDANDENEDAHYLRSNVRFLLGNYRGAASDLTRVIALNPRRGLAYSNRGQARAAMGDKQGAIADLKKALELDPARRDKIQAAIDGLESSAPPAEAEATAASQTDSGGGTSSPMARSAPSEGATVTLEKQGDERAPKPRKAPPSDLDELPNAKPEGAEPGPNRKVRRETGPERSSGEEDSLFIDK